MTDVLNRFIKVTETIPHLLDKLVFVGGGVTEFLITDSAGRKPRPTKDLDCIVEAATPFQYHKIENKLRNAGFFTDPNIPPMICRWIKEDLVLDVMPISGKILGFTNIWYGDALRYPLNLMLPNNQTVHIIHPVYYLATKIEAFKNRGQGDFRASHDFEDIVALLNGREELVEEIMQAKSDVYTAMKSFWSPFITRGRLEVYIQEHLDAYEDEARTSVVMARLRKMFAYQ